MSAVASPQGLGVRLVKLDSGLATPAYARVGDAGIDLLAATDAELAPQGGRALVRTGIAVAIPSGFAGFVLPRSGLAARHGVTLVNAPGLIDAGYRGEIMVALINTDAESPFEVVRGDRIAQLVVQRVEQVVWHVVDDFDDLDDEDVGARTGGAVGAGVRGTGGFGHTGR